MGDGNLILTSKEIYYLGTLLRAKYIDYAYVSIMEDIQRNYTVFESETKEELINKNIVEEDFSGNLLVNQEYQTLLAPIYMGEYESSLQIMVRQSEEIKSMMKRFHFYDGSITVTSECSEGFRIQQIDLNIIEEWIKNLFSGPIKEDKIVMPMSKLNEGFVSSVIIARNTKVGIEENTEIMIVYQGHVLKENSDGMAESVSNEELCQTLLGKIKEA